MPKCSKENKHQKSAKSKQQQKNSKKPLKSAFYLKHNIIKKCCVRVRKGFGQKDCRKMASIGAAGSSKQCVAAGETQTIITIDDSDDDQLALEKSSMENCQTEPPKKKCKVSSATCVEVKCSENMASLKEEQNKVHGFIGVEYVVKLCDENGLAKRYECLLCELNLSFLDIRQHLLDYRHRMKFCEQHFPTAIQQLRQLVFDVPTYELDKVMAPMLQKLAEAIEKQHGRAQPFECSQNRFQKEHGQVLAEVFARTHATEQNGPKFNHVVNSQEVSKLISELNITNSQEKTVVAPIFEQLNSSVTSSVIQATKLNTQTPKGLIENIGDDMRTHFQLSQPYHIDMSFSTHPHIAPQPCVAYLEQSYDLPQNCLAAKDGHPSSPSQSHLCVRHESHSLTASQEVWRSYCHLVDQAFNALNERWHQYKVNPESYPSYDQEWHKFCHNRSTELMAMGKDYRSYDYRSEWLSFFNNRIEEQFEEAFESFKIRFRKELSLPLTNDFVLDAKYYVSVKSTEIETSEKPIEPIAIIDLEQPSETSKVQSNETPNFVAVLGLLTALEEHLGCLGPRIVDLLTKALRAEKTSLACSLNLLNEENCALLETVMEKFKGLIIANILDDDKERALRMAVENVSAFLEVARNNKRLAVSRQRNF